MKPTDKINQQGSKFDRAKQFRAKKPKPNVHHPDEDESEGLVKSTPILPESKAETVSIIDTYGDTPKKRGRKKLAESMSPDEIQAEIDELLNDLKRSIDADEKKRIRRALRLRGHTGGLNKPKKGSATSPYMKGRSEYKDHAKGNQ